MDSQHTTVLLLVSRSLPSFIPRALNVLGILPTSDEITIEAVPRGKTADCPDCGTQSRRIHSCYRRVLRDLPWQGRPVTLRVAARRFRCCNTDCERQTFAEPLDDVAAVSARQTGRLEGLQRHLALALGGEPGARLAARLAFPISPDTLLRRAISTVGGSACSGAAPKVLGVDDWSWRRGRRYGTALVDLERNRVIDLLPDRQAATLAAWLREHPGAEIIARDRAGAYADGARQGAPDAIQVADRWHVLRNLYDAVEALGDRYAGAAKQVADHVREQLQAAATMADPLLPPAPRQSTAAQRASQASLERRRAIYQEVAQMKACGTPLRRIAATLRLERKTVRRWLRLGEVPTWAKPARGSILDRYSDFLDRRQEEGCSNAAQLWRELVVLGFRGRPTIVRKWIRERRSPVHETSDRKPPLPTWPVPAGRRLAQLLMSSAEELPAADSLFVSCLFKQQPALAATIEWAKTMRQVLRRKATANLSALLDAGSRTLLGQFVTGLSREAPAIAAALALPWSTSPVEGQISRLKMLKRTMYGRAGFALLRARVLHVA